MQCPLFDNCLRIRRCRLRVGPPGRCQRSPAESFPVVSSLGLFWFAPTPVPRRSALMSGPPRRAAVARCGLAVRCGCGDALRRVRLRCASGPSGLIVARSVFPAGPLGGTPIVVCWPSSRCVFSRSAAFSRNPRVLVTAAISGGSECLRQCETRQLSTSVACRVSFFMGGNINVSTDDVFFVTAYAVPFVRAG